jgi:hypothetical protein
MMSPRSSGSNPGLLISVDSSSSRSRRWRQSPPPAGTSTERLLPCRGGVLLLRARRDQRGIQVDGDQAALYHERREIENSYGEIKTRLRGAAFILRSRSPELVCREVLAFLTVYQALCALKAEAARHAGLDPDRISPVQETRPRTTAQPGHLQDQNQTDGAPTSANTLTHRHCSSKALSHSDDQARPFPAEITRLDACGTASKIGTAVSCVRGAQRLHGVAG